MEYCKKKLIKNAYESYLKSYNYCLSDCYSNWSYHKEDAFNYCRDLVNKYEGRQGRIIGYCIMSFSYGFIGKINNKEAFFYITRDYDRYIYLEDLED